MRREDELGALRPGSDQRQAQQRRSPQYELIAQVVGEEPLKSLAALRTGQRGEVEVAPGQGNAADDDLNGLAARAADEPGAQAGVPVEQRLASRSHPVGIDQAGQLEYQLYLIDVERRAGQRRVE